MSPGLSDAEVMTPEEHFSDADVMTAHATAPTPTRGSSISGGGLPIAAQIYPRLAPLMEAFGHGFKEGYGPEQLRGLPDETVKMLSDAKIFGPAKGGYDNPLQAAAEMLANSALVPLQATEQAFRGVSGLMRGAAAVSEELGLPRDISGILGGEYVPAGGGLHVAPTTVAAMRLFGPQHPFGPIKGMPVVLREVPPESRIAPVAAEGVPKSIEAYHGSPHDFERFDISKIGTGEGAQAYGHGIYFAENEATARDYQKKLSPKNDTEALAIQLSENLGRPWAHLSKAEQLDMIEEVQKNPNISAELSGRASEKNIGGTIYRVRINADPEHFLDWDKPLSEQSQVAQNIAARLRKDYPNLPDDFRHIQNGSDLIEAARSVGVDAEKMLREAGIPGIKYLDRGSRGEGGGTRNFVVFDDNSVEITHKNNVPVGPADIPDRNAVSPALTEARELGVIGPPKPSVTERLTQEDQARAKTMAAEGPKGEKVTQSIGGVPADAWEERFHKFVSKLETPDDVKSAILDAARENGNFEEIRQGKMPLRDVEDIAAAAGVDSSEIDQGRISKFLNNPERVRGAMKIMTQLRDEVTEAARAVKADGSEENLVKLQEAIMRRDVAVENVVGLRAEWGKTGNVFQEFLAKTKEEEGLSNFLKDKGRTPDGLRKIADTISGLNDPDQIARHLSALRNASLWDKYLYLWVNALISGPVTHLKYIFANAAFGAYEAGVVTPIAGAIGAVRRGLLGGTEGVYVGEAAARTWGLLAGAPDALKAARTAFREGIMTKLPGEQVASALNPLTQQRVAPIGGIPGYVIGVPSRSASFIHTFFRFVGFRAEIEARAYRNAVKEGLSPITDGDRFWQRRADLANAPSPEDLAAGIENGDHLTFITEQGEFGKATSRWVNTRLDPGGIQPLKLIMPFTHIPGNILKAGLEQTPAAFADTKIRGDLLGKNGAVKQDMAVARLVAGGVIGAMVANWAVNDAITGYGPTDRDERLRWLRTHEPYSVRLGGWWVSYNKFGPIGDLLGLHANLIDIGPKVSEGDYAGAVGQLIKASGRMLEDEVGMQGIVNLIEAMEDPDRKMSRLLSSQAASNIPYSSLLRQTASFQDPILREAKTFVDGLRYATPWSRQDLLPKRDWLGEPMTNPGYHSILRQRAVNPDPIDIEVSQMRGIRPAPPLARINNVALPPKLYDEYQAYAGGMTRAALEPMVTAPGWQSLPVFAREQAIHGTIEKMRRTAEAIMWAKHPEIVQQGVDDKKAKINGEKPTKLKD